MMSVKNPQKIPAMMAATVLMILLFGFPSGSSMAAKNEAKVSGHVRFESGSSRESIVYLLSQDPDHSPPDPLVMTIRQREMNFEPRFGIVTPGSTIRFENNDNEMHNIKSNSPENRFDTGAHMPGTVKEVKLKRAGPVRLRCSIHSEMRAFLFVSPSMYYGIVDSKGRFSIDQVPFGSYRAEVWNQRMTPGEVQDAGQSIQVFEETIRLVFNLKPSAPEGSDMAEVVDRDWGSVRIEIRKALDQVLSRWKRTGRSSALLKLMTAYARHYNKSGFHDAIIQRLGKIRAAEHDDRFNALTKALNKDRPSPLDEAEWRRLTEVLLGGLDRDIQMFGTSRAGSATAVPKENRR